MRSARRPGSLTFVVTESTSGGRFFIPRSSSTRVFTARIIASISTDQLGSAVSIAGCTCAQSGPSPFEKDSISARANPWINILMRPSGMRIERMIIATVPTV